jgi:hypothetical protein
MSLKSITQQDLKGVSDRQRLLGRSNKNPRSHGLSPFGHAWRGRPGTICRAPLKLMWRKSCIHSHSRFHVDANLDDRLQTPPVLSYPFVPLRCLSSLGISAILLSAKPEIILLGWVVPILRMRLTLSRSGKSIACWRLLNRPLLHQVWFDEFDSTRGDSRPRGR